MWNGEFFQRMNVYVDLAPAVESHRSELNGPPPPLGIKPCKAFFIPKMSRHDEACPHTLFHVSHSSTEQAVISALPLNVKNGLMLAKAARIASIARPTCAEDLTSHYGLLDDIHVDDFITSYLLKTCLMKLLPRHSQTQTCNCSQSLSGVVHETSQCACKWKLVVSDTACGWAIRIYEKLKTELKANEIETWYYDRHTIVYCTRCKVERGCCKKRKLTLAMTSQILNWLKQHHRQLKHIGSESQSTWQGSRRFATTKKFAECRSEYRERRLLVYCR